GSQEPCLVDHLTQLTPRLLLEQQVVPLGDHQWSVFRYRYRTGDRFLDLAAEFRCVHELGTLAESADEVYVTVGVEGVRRTLAVHPAEAVQLDLGQVEPVHTDDNRPGAELVGELPRQ